MKRIGTYIAAFICFGVIAACGGNDDTEPTLDPDGGSSPKLYTQSITIPAKGGEQSMTLIDLRSAISSIGSTPAWVVISPKQYTTGAPSIKLEVEENKASAERKCDVSILAASGDKVVLTVIQQAGGGGSTEPGTDIDDPHNEQTDQPANARR